MNKQIFISYRREDSRGSTGRLYDRLIRHFDQDKIFMDVDTIAPGDDFIETIEQAVSKCAVLVVVIGNRWVHVSDKQGQRKLEKPSDFVRTEIRIALERKILIIPVLVEDATMPGSDELPDDLKPLTGRNAIEISHIRFNIDIERLVNTIKKRFEIDQQKEEQLWNEVLSENTIEAYQGYLINYPTGKNVEIVNERIKLVQEQDERAKIEKELTKKKKLEEEKKRREELSRQKKPEENRAAEHANFEKEEEKRAKPDRNIVSTTAYPLRKTTLIGLLPWMIWGFTLYGINDTVHQHLHTYAEIMALYFLMWITITLLALGREWNMKLLIEKIILLGSLALLLYWEFWMIIVHDLLHFRSLK